MLKACWVEGLFGFGLQVLRVRISQFCVCSTTPPPGRPLTDGKVKGQRAEDVVSCLKQHLQHECLDGTSGAMIVLSGSCAGLHVRFAKRRSCNQLEIATLSVSAPWDALRYVQASSSKRYVNDARQADPRSLGWRSQLQRRAARASMRRNMCCL